MADTPHKGLSESDPLDILIVGGGPAGTAAAFRATELNRSVMVIDRDVILSILRDFVEQDKMVDADYEDCKGRPFPSGGEIVEQLRYPDQTPAKVLNDRWLTLYEQHQIPYHNRAELVGIEQRSDDILQATWQGESEQSSVFCRAIILAVGRGSNPKLELMGDTKGIRYRLRKPNEFVGAPACVIGGGMSAAEAVVAISNAKAASDDPTAVYWVNRRKNLPRVAKGVALAPKFYEAWTRGNIEYLPLSKPMAVLKGDDGEDVFAVRVQRRETANNPAEVVCYEFSKKQVLACIGADRPDVFLNSVGIDLFEAADSPKPKRLAVSRILQSQVPRVFMAGSILDPSYIEAADFRPETLQNTVREHPGCFKTAVTDGVLAVEAIDKVLSGQSIEDVGHSLTQIKEDFAGTAAPTATPPAPAPQPEHESETEGTLAAAFVHVQQKKEQGRLSFAPGTVVIGRSAGDVTFPADQYLVDNHGALRIETEECYATDKGCAGVTYVGIQSERTASAGTIFTAGSQRLRLDHIDGTMRLAQLDAEGNVARHLDIPVQGETYGRKELAPDDAYLSNSHFDVHDKGDVVLLRDCSRNGTYIEVHGTLRLNVGDEVCMGDQRFRFAGMSTGGVATAPEAHAATAATAATAMPDTDAPATATPATAAPTTAPAAGGAPVVVFDGGAELAVDAEMPILHFMFEDSYASDDEDEIEGQCQTLFECWDPDDPLTSGGKCGKCAITITAGADFLEPATGKERNTIEKKALKNFKTLDAALCRLACKCIAKAGPVHVTPSGKP